MSDLEKDCKKAISRLTGNQLRDLNAANIELVGEFEDDQATKEVELTLKNFLNEKMNKAEQSYYKLIIGLLKQAEKGLDFGVREKNFLADVFKGQYTPGEAERHFKLFAKKHRKDLEAKNMLDVGKEDLTTLLNQLKISELTNNSEYMNMWNLSYEKSVKGSEQAVKQLIKRLGVGDVKKIILTGQEEINQASQKTHESDETFSDLSGEEDEDLDDPIDDVNNNDIYRELEVECIDKKRDQLMHRNISYVQTHQERATQSPILDLNLNLNPREPLKIKDSAQS